MTGAALACWLLAAGGVVGLVTAGGGVLVLLGFCSGGFTGSVILGCSFGCGVAGGGSGAFLSISAGGGCCGWRGGAAGGAAGGTAGGALGGAMACRCLSKASLTACCDSRLFCVRQAKSCILWRTLWRQPWRRAATCPKDSCTCCPISARDWLSNWSLRSKFHQKLH